MLFGLGWVGFDNDGVMMLGAMQLGFSIERALRFDSLCVYFINFSNLMIFTLEC